MRLVEINEAEAIVEPFWEGGTSEHTNPHKNYCVLDEYHIKYGSNTIGQISQGWAFASIVIDKATKGEVAMSLSRDCSLDIRAYDTFKIFASIPEELFLDVYVKIDGVYEKIGDRIKGHGITGEYDLPIKGNKLTAIKIDFLPTKDYLIANIAWLGLSHSQRVQYMESRTMHYNSQWTGLFKDKSNVAINTELGILFDNEDLDGLRAKFTKEPFKSAYKGMVKLAKGYMNIEPEQFIGTYVAKADRRWCRDRDMNKPEMHIMMENLAFVGLIEKDYDMLKMACRYALSVAHCTYWCESIMGVFPGAIWHHRSFTEEIYCKSCGYVLDWAGSLLTPYGKQIIRDAITMKGLPRLEADFKCVDYIRYMNQGIVFSGGRITGLLGLVHQFPRYHSNILEAEQDIIDMIHNYVKEDGGTLEGPHYWQYTFSSVLPSLYALARYKKQPFSIYADLLSQTGKFILSHLSQQDDGTILLPINDAHPGIHLNATIAYSFYALTGEKVWLLLYTKLLEKGYVSDDVFTLVASPLVEKPEGNMELQPGFFETTGQVDIHRQGKDIKKAHLHYCSGELYVGHSHQDKGSIILEAEGKTLCPDCGTGYYHDANSSTLCCANNHSLFMPVFDNGKLARQPMGRYGGTITQAKQEGDFVTIASDESEAWEEGLMKSSTRKILSPCAEVYIVIDQVELFEEHEMKFLLNAYADYKKLDNGKFKANFDVCSLNVMPLNWNCETSHVRHFLDGEKDDVYQLELTSKKSKKHYIVTAIILENNDRFEVAFKDNDMILSSDHYTISVIINDDTIHVNMA